MGESSSEFIVISSNVTQFIQFVTFLNNIFAEISLREVKVYHRKIYVHFGTFFHSKNKVTQNGIYPLFSHIVYCKNIFIIL